MLNVENNNWSKCIMEQNYAKERINLTLNGLSITKNEKDIKKINNNTNCTNTLKLKRTKEIFSTHTSTKSK